MSAARYSLASAMRASARLAFGRRMRSLHGQFRMSSKLTFELEDDDWVEALNAYREDVALGSPQERSTPVAPVSVSKQAQDPKQPSSWTSSWSSNASMPREAQGTKPSSAWSSSWTSSASSGQARSEAEPSDSTSSSLGWGGSGTASKLKWISAADCVRSPPAVQQQIPPPSNLQNVWPQTKAQNPGPLRGLLNARTYSRGYGPGEEVEVSAARLDQLLEAEITALALRDPKPLTLQTLTGGTTEEELAQLLHEELPVRFAQRIKMLESLPDWKAKLPIASVREMYVTSFKELRLADPNAPEQFQKQLKHIKERHAHTNLLVGGFKLYAEDGSCGVEINEWLDRFFALRVSTNMLMSHYLQMARFSGGSSVDMRAPLMFDPEYNPYRSSIDSQCDAARIAKHAAYVVGAMARLQYGVVPQIVVRDCGSKKFPFVPRYLFYVLSELLKNSVRATIETHCPACAREFTPGSRRGHEHELWEKDLPPINVIVTGDEHVCTMCVSDQGGGIPVANLHKVWSYLYTTAEPIETPVSRSAVDAPADLRRLMRQEAHVAGDPDDEIQSILFRSPLAGLGCGLPLSRLYAKYLGGSIELQTLPRHGVDVFVCLNKLGTLSETLPHL